MKQRGASLPQSKMILLLIRTSALALLLSLMAGTITTATVEEGLTCRQELPAHLLHSLWNRTKALVNKLPKETFHRRMRLLPEICVRCSECVCVEPAVGWTEMRDMIDVYQRSVFSRKVVQNLLPEHYIDLLYRLQHTLQHCVSSSEPSQWFKIISKMEKKIKKRKRDEGSLKAVGEFTFVLRWITELAQQRSL